MVKIGYTVYQAIINHTVILSGEIYLWYPDFSSPTFTALIQLKAFEVSNGGTSKSDAHGTSGNVVGGGLELGCW